MLGARSSEAALRGGIGGAGGAEISSESGSPGLPRFRDEVVLTLSVWSKKRKIPLSLKEAVESFSLSCGEKRERCSSVVGKGWDDSLRRKVEHVSLSFGEEGGWAPLSLNETWRRPSSVWDEISPMPLRFGGKVGWIPLSLRGIGSLCFP